MKEPFLSDEAFVADAAQARADPAVARLWWLGQSGFLVHWMQNYALLDPYLSDSLTVKYADTDRPHVRMSRRVVDPARLDFVCVVTSSHNHTDHLDSDTLKPLLKGAQCTMVAPAANLPVVAERAGLDIGEIRGLDNGIETEFCGFSITGVAAAHETIERDELGRCKFLGYVVRFDSLAIYHSGDTLLYDGLVEQLRPFKIDIALLPINGRASERRVAGNLNGREAAWLAKEIGAKLAIPCHYDMFAFNTAAPDEFVAECERIGQPYRVLRLGERFTIGPKSR